MKKKLTSISRFQVLLVLAVFLVVLAGGTNYQSVLGSKLPTQPQQEGDDDLSGASEEENLVLNISQAAAVEVEIGGARQGELSDYAIASGDQQVVNYGGLFGGPLIVESPNGVSIVSALRDLWTSDTGSRTSYVQVMGMPSSLLSNKYVFPTYSNVVLNEQLRFANVGNSDTYVTVTIGGEKVVDAYLLHPNEQWVGNFPDLFGGPVVVEGSDVSVPIIASLRDLWTSDTGSRTSYAQVMGMSSSLLSNKYVFPTYSNIVLNEQLRISVP